MDRRHGRDCGRPVLGCAEA